MLNIPDWLITIIGVVVGALISIGIPSLIQYFRRPRLTINWEKRLNQCPYIPDYHDDTIPMVGREHRIKYLRLLIQNTGKTPAKKCEVRLELTPDNEELYPYKVTLHWSRLDPALYKI